MIGTHRGRIPRTFLILLLTATGPVLADSLIVIHPESWETAITNLTRFKTRLGFNVTNVTTEAIAGTHELTAPRIREFLLQYRTHVVAQETCAYALFVGNFNTIPAPSFRVVPAGRESADAAPYASDIYYRDLHSEFDRDGDDVFGEYSTNGVAEDFDDSTFGAALSGITNDLLVGRIPVNSAWSSPQVAKVIDRSIRFEREVSTRKRNAILSAGRIIMNQALLIPSDSWDFVMKDMVSGLTNDFPSKSLTTVVHVAPTYGARDGMDVVIEGNNLTADYGAGQNAVRELLETGGPYAFLCNVSHGGPQYDFAITRSGAGFPRNVEACVMLSMSCASYHLGRVAYTNGLAAGYVCSVATVMPDAFTVIQSLGAEKMVSAEVQDLGVRRIFCENQSLGKALKEGHERYIEGIQSPKAAYTFNRYKPEVLRNVIGFQVIGDPSLVYAYPDQDGDGLLDPEELVIGSSIVTNDTDGDGLDDGFEDRTPGLNPIVHDGEDVDGDGSHNADEGVAGTDPLDPEDRLAFEHVTLQTGRLVASWSSVTGRLYTVYWAPGSPPSLWTQSTDFIDVDGGGAMLSYTNHDPGPAGTFRIGVRRP